MSKFGPIGILLVSFAGMLDAAYLSAKNLTGETPDCVLFSGCDIVTTSAYSTIGPVPVAILGLFFYLAVFFLGVAYLTSGQVKIIRTVFYLSLPAMVFTAYLVFLQFFVIKAVCVYCMFSALTATSVFLLSFFFRRSNGDKVNLLNTSES